MFKGHIIAVHFLALEQRGISLNIITTAMNLTKNRGKI